MQNFLSAFKCRLGFETQTTCDSDDAPNCEWQRDSDDGTWECGLSSHALGLLLSEAGRECDFEEPSAADMTASEHDLCSYYEADAKCSGKTTQLSCSLDPDCKWYSISEDPFYTLYPCLSADGKDEQRVKLLLSDMSSYVNVWYECRVHSSKAECIDDVECSWSYATGSGTSGETCVPNNIKMSKYYEHPHVAAAAQMQKVCSGVSQDECGSGTTAGKCQWAEASSGGDAECIHDREYAINAMSCTCPQLTELLEEEGISAEPCTPSPPPPASPAPPPSEPAEPADTSQNCKCSCCTGNYCSASLVASYDAESSSDCGVDDCRSRFSTLCPASGESGRISASYSSEFSTSDARSIKVMHSLAAVGIWLILAY